MRARIVPLLVAFALAGCKTTERKLKEVNWGEGVEADYFETLERARFVLNRHFPKGFDPDRTDEGAGDLWTIWHMKKSVLYRNSVRERARCRVEKLEDGKVRVGVAIVVQKNDNIENPSIMSEARWVNATRDPDRERLIEEAIVKRYSKLEPSEQWEERHRQQRRGTVRKDLIDRYKDIDVGESEAKDTKTPDSITSRDDFWDAHKALDDLKKRRKEERRQDDEDE